MNIPAWTFKPEHCEGRRGRGLTLTALAVALAIPSGFDAAALEADNFSAREYFPPPHYTNLQYQLDAAQGRTLAGGRQSLTKVRLQTWRISGERQLVIEADECVFDENARSAESGGPLRVRSGDGRFRIAGRGFSWRQVESRLVISNEVHAVMERPGTNAAAPLEITSRWFEFDHAKHRGVFHDDVRGKDAELDFSCGQLAISAATNQSAFDRVEADQSLEITGRADGPYAGRRASAQRGIYRRADETVELTGEAGWQLGRHQGRADRVVAHKADGSFEAEGRVALKLPRESLGAAGGLLNASNASPAGAQSSPVVDLFAERCAFRTNGFVAEGGVRLLDGTNQLTCDRLEAREAAPGSTEDTAVATGNVIVEREGGSIIAGRAVFAQADGSVVFTGQPRWRQDQITGSAERLTIRTRSGEALAENDVKVIVPLGPGTGSFLSFFPSDAATNRTGTVVEVFARNFLAKERRVTFSGDARAHQQPRTGSEPRLRSDELEVRFSTNARPRVERLEARGNAVYEQGTPGVTNGPATHRRMTAPVLAANADPATGELAELTADGGVLVEDTGHQATGDRAVYTRATDVLKLTGKTVLETAQVIITESPEVYWSRAEKKFIAREPCVIRVKPEALKQAGELQKLP